MADVQHVVPSARLTLKKNTSLVIVDMVHQPDPETFSKRAGMTISVAALSSTTLNLGSISTARFVFLKTDKTVTVKFNADANGIVVTAEGVILMAGVTVTSIAVHNLHATDTAIVRYEVTD